MHVRERAGVRFWTNFVPFAQNQSLTTAVLCPLLHCHQFKWTLFENGKVRKFDICSSTISQKQPEGDGETERERVHLVSFTRLFSQGPGSSRLQNLQ